MSTAQTRANYSATLRALASMGPIQSRLQPNSYADQVWRLGFADGLDADPCFGQQPGAYRIGYRQGAKLARLVAEGAPQPASFPLPDDF